MIRRRNGLELAIFSGTPVFSTIRSTSNLVRPNIEDFLAYARRSFEQRRLTNNGPAVVELEQRLAALHETPHCVTFCNGLWGLVLCAKQLALAGRSEVIMPTMTYRRLADIAAWVGLTPHFCDVECTRP